MRRSEAAGWAPMDPLFRELVHYEALRVVLGDRAVDGPLGPPVEWPTAWGLWALAEHRATIALHRREMESIRAEERSA